MAEPFFEGEIKARIIEVRFALSGKVERVLRTRNDLVGKGELLARLDRKILQAELDKQLADYEKVRADFEIFNLQKGEPKDDLTKYLKAEKQAQLNASVKEVELSKAKLDQADLFSPVEGIVLDDSNLVAGLYLTPSSSPYRILEVSSYFFEILIGQEDLSLFNQSRKVEIEILGFDRKIQSETGPVYADEKGYYVKTEIPDKQGLLLGLKGKAIFL